MLEFNHIASKDNSLIKRIVRLARESKFRQNEQQAVIYGEHLLFEALKFGLIEQAIISDTVVEKYKELIEGLIDQSIVVKLASSEVMQKINVLESTVDVVAIIRFSSHKSIVDSQIEDSLVLENIQDPGNLGTILRAAYASGINQIVLSANSVDIYNPKVLRASQGIQFGLRICSGVNLVDWISNYRGQVLAMVPSANLSLYEQNLALPTAFVLGNEGSGLSSEILSQIKTQVSIPMLGDAESLNLAMAATIGVFEMSRQRIINQRK